MQLIIDSPLRQQWEKTLIKFEYKTYSKDYSQQRICFRYTNPMTTASRGSGDKQLILDQTIWNDFPKKGLTTVHYDNVNADSQWPLTDNITALKMKHLEYVIAPSDKGCTLTIFAALQHTSNEPGWVIDIALRRTPSAWCEAIIKAAFDYE